MLHQNSPTKNLWAQTGWHRKLMLPVLAKWRPCFFMAQLVWRHSFGYFSVAADRKAKKNYYGACGAKTAMPNKKPQVNANQLLSSKTNPKKSPVKRGFLIKNTAKV